MGLKVRCLKPIDQWCYPRCLIVALFCGCTFTSASVSRVSWIFVRNLYFLQVFVSPHQSLVSSSLDLRPASTGLSLANSSLTALEVEIFRSKIFSLAGGDEGAWLQHHQLGSGFVGHCHQNRQVSPVKGETSISEVSTLGGRVRPLIVSNIQSRLEELGLEGARVRRELTNPLYSVSSSK